MNISDPLSIGFITSLILISFEIFIVLEEI